MTRHVTVSYEDLEGLFHLPLREAASELGLCPTTFKKACRKFSMTEWPFRKGQSRIPFGERASQPDGVDAARRPLHQELVYAPAAPTLQTSEEHQAMHAVTVSCTSHVWHDGSIARRDPPAFGFPFSSTASSRSAVPAPWYAPHEHRASSELRLDFPSPFGALPSSGAPKGLRQHAPTTFDMRSYQAARHSGPALQHTPLDVPSSMNFFSVGMPIPQGQATTRPPSGDPGGARSSAGGRSAVAQPALGRELVAWQESVQVARHASDPGPDRRPEAGPPGERPCVQAVMEYLDGPLAGNFDFMFADEEGGEMGVLAPPSPFFKT